ncbi:MAG: hypothetical protein EOP51_08010 [Sphingobacteriales bacterium]|nr:MAG: hypothetical protein EOP51_08010 [Sphingobacteriales bacterium]
MKHFTLALATVMLPVLSYAYKAVPLCNKTLKIANVKLELIQDHSKDYCSVTVPPGTIRLIINIGLDDRQPKPGVQLHTQLQERLQNGAPIYVVGGMVNKQANRSSIDIATFDNVICTRLYVDRSNDECRPLIWEHNTRAGTYDIQVVPMPYAGQYYICFRNQGDTTECYATVEAVAILN